jgi:hypothetical protein
MKICILSFGRTGSTSLFRAIFKHLGQDFYRACEPFNYSALKFGQKDENAFEHMCNQNNVFIKTHIHHGPKGKSIDFMHEWIFNFFDKVILLDRKDTIALTESHAYMMYSKSKDWHSKQFYDISTIPTEFIKEWETRICEYKKTINELSIKYDKKIYYYEDIFLDKNMEIIDEIFNYIEIKPNFRIIENDILSDNNKVRLENIKSLI